MTEALERIPSALFQDRLPALLRMGKPAIVTDLFQNQKIEQILDEQLARELLGETMVAITTNYTQGNLERVRNYQRGVPTARKLEQRFSTFAGYTELIARDPESRCMVAEEPTPLTLLQGIDLSAFGIDTVVSGCGGFGTHNPAPHATALSMMFIANRGNSSDLHFDGDGRDVVLYQGFGRKRVILFPPETSPLLHPVANFSTIPLAKMDDNERAAFLTYVGGVEHVLMPGEALFMPAFIWHHFDYLDLSLSVSFRFGGISDPDAKRLQKLVHLDHYTQNIMAGTRDPARAELCRAAARRLCAAALDSYPSTREKFRAMRGLAEQCLRSTQPPKGRAYINNMIEVSDFLDGGLSGFYSNPPEGSVARRVVWKLKENIRDGLRRLGRKLAYWA